MVEDAARATARFPAALLPRLLGIPLLLGTRLLSIEGRDRVEGVVLECPEGERRLEADGVVVTGRFRPEATLAWDRRLAIDPATGGPEIDEYGRTSDPAVFAAGNVLRPVETAGWCWEEGRRVGMAMAGALRGELPRPATSRIHVEGAVRYVVPQRRAGGARPAFDVLQLRAAHGCQGRLSLRAEHHETAGRTGAFLPERRLLLPLPPAGGGSSVVLEAGE
jgi:NADPH-dependent 2,4-dienoyl-CoA reductase/sulfur reductase-like enzyme